MIPTRHFLLVKQSPSMPPRQKQLAEAGLDLLTAQTVPAVSEAEGMARAMIATGLPAVIGLCITREGQVLRRHAAWMMPSTCSMSVSTVRPLGYAVNCSHPIFSQGGADEPHALCHGLIGISGPTPQLRSSTGSWNNASKPLRTTSTSWADAMVKLHKTHGVKILGGCCGTTDRHLRSICEKVRQITR